MKERIPNFDILRTIAMLFIVFWHFHIHGLDVLDSRLVVDFGNPWFVVNCIFSELVLSITCIAVNCYVLITGYFLIHKYKFDILKVEKVWFHAIFYSIVIAFIVSLFTNGLNTKIWVKSVAFIFFKDTYWFVIYYLALIILAPFISQGVHALSNRKYLLLLLILSILLVDVYGNVSFANEMGASGGFSLLWFIYLFLVGGFIRRLPCNKRRLGFYRNIFLVFWSINLLVITILFIVRHYIMDNVHLSMYNNIFVLALSISFFLLIKAAEFKSSIWRILLKVSPYVFGVYLIHDNFILRNLIWPKLDLKQYIGSYFYIPIMFMVCVTIFIVCVFVDYLRIRIVVYLNIGQYLVLINNRVCEAIRNRYIKIKD